MASSKTGAPPIVEVADHPSPPATEVGKVIELDGSGEVYVPDPAREKKLLRKVDFVMIPMLWWMCVLAYVDRNNIGNAKAAGMSMSGVLRDDYVHEFSADPFIAGMDDDLGLGDQSELQHSHRRAYRLLNTGYAMLINIFFIAYLLGEVPSNIILAKSRPSLYIPGLMTIWGALVRHKTTMNSGEGR